MSLELGFTDIVIETESEEALFHVNAKIEDFPLKFLILMIDDVMKRNEWNCSINLVSSQANEPAKFIANYGLDYANGITGVVAPPPGLGPILENENGNHDADEVADMKD